MSAWILISLFAIAVCFLAVVLFGISTNPVKHRGIPYSALPTLLRSLAETLHDRGTIYVGHQGSRGEIWVRKHVYKRRPSELELRVRNADQTRQHFKAIRIAFERDDREYYLERTKVRRQPRALVVRFSADDPTSYSGIAHSLRVCFAAMGAPSDSSVVVWAVDSFSYEREIAKLDEFAASNSGPRSWLARILARRLRRQRGIQQ